MAGPALGPHPQLPVLADGEAGDGIRLEAAAGALHREGLPIPHVVEPGQSLAGAEPLVPLIVHGDDQDLGIGQALQILDDPPEPGIAGGEGGGEAAEEEGAGRVG